MIEIRAERPEDGAAIEALLDIAFGSDRLTKSSYSYRRGVERLWPLCLAALRDGVLVGTIRAWPLRIGTDRRPAILVGPVAVAPAERSCGLGARLVRLCLERARAAGHPVAILVGDEPYYGRFGFRPAARLDIAMERENPARVLALPLQPDLDVPKGTIQPWRLVRPLPLAA